MPPLCFAYGSNLCAQDLQRWCAGRGRDYPLGPGRPAWLADVDLVFDIPSEVRRGGVLNLRPRPGQVVPGAVFEVLPGGWETLDLKEGVPRMYARVTVTVLTEDGATARAMAYQAPPSPERGHVPPHVEYYEVVRRGLRDYGHGASQLGVAAAGAETPWGVTRVFLPDGSASGGSGERDKGGVPLTSGHARGSGVEERRRAVAVLAPGVLHPAHPGGRVPGEVVGSRHTISPFTTPGGEESPVYSEVDTRFRRLVRAVTGSGSGLLAWLCRP